MPLSLLWGTERRALAWQPSSLTTVPQPLLHTTRSTLFCHTVSPSTAVLVLAWHNHHVLSTFFCLANVWTFRLIDSHSDSSFNHQQQNHKEKSPYLSCTKYNNIYYINSYCVISQHYIFCNITLHHTSTFVISYHTIYFISHDTFI